MLPNNQLSTSSYLHRSNNHNKHFNDPNSMSNTYCHNRYSNVSVSDSYRNSFVNTGSHCFGSTINTAPCVYRTNYRGQDYIVTQSSADIGFSTEYVCHYNQKENDSTGVFVNFHHKVDYIAITSSKVWDNIVYVHTNENNNVKGLYYLSNGVIYDCSVILDGFWWFLHLVSLT